MTSLFTKRKILTLTISLILVTLSSALFVYGEGKMNSGDYKSSLLGDSIFETFESEEYYRNIAENQTDAVLILKKDAMIHFSSNDFRDELKYTNEDLQNLNFFTLIHPKDLPFVANIMLDIINEEKEIDNIGPFRVKNSEGQYTLYIANGKPIQTKENHIDGFALILKDISTPLGGSSALNSELAFNL